MEAMMKKTKFELGNVTSLTMNINCDLKLLGWEKPEIFTEADEEVLTVTAEGSSAHIECDCDCIMSVPNSIRIDKLHVGGDASIVDFLGGIENVDIGGDLDIARGASISIKQVGGDLQIRQMSDNCSVGQVCGDFEGLFFEKNLLVTNISGDCSISEVKGEMEIKSIGGDCNLRAIKNGTVLQNVGGDCQIDGVVKGLFNSKIGGDFVSPNLTGDISVFAGGDISASIPGVEVQKVFLQAGGDISLHFIEKPSAKFELKSSPEGTILDFEDRKENLSSAKNEFVLGEGNGMYKLTAGGEILLSQQPWTKDFSHKPFQHFDGTFEKIMEKMRQRIDLDERIAEKAELLSERAAKHAEKITKKVEKKVAKAMDRLEQKLNTNQSKQGGYSHPIEEAEFRSETKQVPVSEEEKTLILKMLQEKKITPEEAEKLFEALENKAE
jgi:hypothetical protein